MTDLIERLREHAALHGDLAAVSKEQALWQSDLMTAADIIERLREFVEDIASHRRGDCTCYICELARQAQATLKATEVPHD